MVLFFLLWAVLTCCKYTHYYWNPKTVWTKHLIRSHSSNTNGFSFDRIIRQIFPIEVPKTELLGGWLDNSLLWFLPKATNIFSPCEIELKISLKHTCHKILGKFEKNYEEISPFQVDGVQWLNQLHCSFLWSLMSYSLIHQEKGKCRANHGRYGGWRGAERWHPLKRFPNFSFFVPKLSPFAHIYLFCPQIILLFCPK